MSTTKVQALLWLLVAGLACACDPGPPWERTHDHRTGRRGEEPATDNDVDEAEATDATPTTRDPAPSEEPPSEPPAEPPASIPTSEPPAAPATHEQPSTPSPPSSPAEPKPGLRLRGSLRIALELPLGIAVRVRLSTLLESGVLRELASGELDAAGTFDLLLSAELEPGLLLAELLDPRGTRLGAVWGTGRAAADELLTLPVLDLQTWLESEVLLGSLGCSSETGGRPAPMTLLLDVTNWIDPALSAALTQAVARGASRELAVAALARATAAGARARSEVLSLGGVTLGLGLTQLQRDVLERLATQRSSADTAQGGAVDAERAELRRALDATLREAGVLDPALRTRAHVAASLAFGASLRGAFGPSSGLEGALFPALHAAALLETEAGSDNVLELLTAAGADAQTRSAALTAAADLRAEIAAASELAALPRARDKFTSTLFGRANSSSGGLLGGVLGGTLGLVGNLLGNVLQTLQQLTGELDANLALDLARFADAGACGELEAANRRDAASAGLSRTLASFSDQVRSAGTGTAGDANARATAETLAKALASTQLLLRQRN